VIKVGEQLQEIDAAAAGDPDGLITSARTELAAEKHAQKLAADYHTGLHLFDEGRWEEAVATLEGVIRIEATYQDAAALLERARRELGQATAKQAEEKTQRQADDQAQRQAPPGTSADDTSKQAPDLIPPGPPTHGPQKELTSGNRTPKTGAANMQQQVRRPRRVLKTALLGF
jgi:hypothetical protein